jgi:hypothetical protein
MSSELFREITPGVLKIDSDERGPAEVEYENSIYFRFMDYFYIQNNNLDELTSEQVSNLCRARALYPHLITLTNDAVRNIFKVLAQAVKPHSLLEIGAGRNPVFKMGDSSTPDRYILADADPEVIDHYKNLSRECYNFSHDFCELPDLDNFFEMAIAVFVLHFPFYESQLLEIKKRLKPSGIVVANVYRRSNASREILTQGIEKLGFEIIKIQDPKNLCKNHEYWIFGEEKSSIENCANKLMEIIMELNSQ